MNKQVAMGILLLALAPIGNAVAANPQAAMQAKPDQKPTFAMVLDRSLSSVEHEVVPAAEAMPEDKFNFAPTQGEFNGVRTFAQQVKVLKDSFAYLHKAANSIDESNVLGQVQAPFGPNKMTRLGLSVIAISHPFDHYGQMVEYLRMNNIVPPASRPK
jgi:hypothetical protein